MMWENLEFWETDYWANIKKYLNSHPFIPGRKLLFRPLITTPMHKVKVVIIGKEPFFRPNKTDGLAFSDPTECRGGLYNSFVLPTTQNLIKECMRDVGISEPKSGSLLPWAKRGVLLWNSRLSVAENHPSSHSGLNWEALTTNILESLYKSDKKIIFIFLGHYVASLASCLPDDATVILLPSPAPLEASRGFFGSEMFSLTNRLLREAGRKKINWNLQR